MKQGVDFIHVDTGTKSMFIMHFGRSNYISILYIIMKIWSIITPIITLLFLITCFPKNTLTWELDLVYRYIVYNEKTCLWPFYTFCIKNKG